LTAAASPPTRSARSDYLSLPNTDAARQNPTMDIDEPVVLIRPARLYREGMSDEELYEATRGVWRVGDRALGARYAFAVVHGEVVEVYEIESWQPAGTAAYNFRRREEVVRPGRSEFSGRVADESMRRRYLGVSVADCFKKGNQNPIRYVNC
jgi:hypothetical protein